MTRILVPTDFSKTAFQALKFAIQIASIYKAKVMVLHVIDLPANLLMYYPFQGDVIEGIRKQAYTNYTSWVGEIDFKKIEVDFHVVQTTVLAAITSSIKDDGIDLVVMGTKGSSGFSEFFVGSNTEKVVRFSTVPVFSIKQSIDLATLKHIVFPTRLSLKDSNLVTKVKELQAYFNAHLHIVYVNTLSNFKTEREINFMKDNYLAFYGFENFSTHVVSDIDEYAGISAFAKEFSNPLIAMGTHSRKGLAHFFVGSIAEDIVNHAEWPIWTYSTKKK